jgi:16S rRNA (cytosine967-C5)-methyltransferase
VDAADLYPEKLARLREGPAGRLVRTTAVVDWTCPPPLRGQYDRVIVDAPCSGVGTLRRRPEIAFKRHRSDLERLAELQTTILRNAATRVRDGGHVVYAVCSVLREEAEAVVERVVDSASPQVALSPAAFDGPIPKELAGNAGSFRLLPHVHGTDGFFVAHFVARRK